jgi:hypothetical protein
MKDSASQLRSATRRAKSDVANKLISMFLHELSRRICHDWSSRVDGGDYEQLVRTEFDNRCPYCSRELMNRESVIEHLDSMNRYRAGLHVPGNVLVACRDCNSEKRRDDSIKVLFLASSSWESFLSHHGDTCAVSCRTCRYWTTVWTDETERIGSLNRNLQKLRSFRRKFPELERLLPELRNTLPDVLAKLYADCQIFAETEIKSLLETCGQLHRTNLQS